VVNLVNEVHEMWTKLTKVI